MAAGVVVAGRGEERRRVEGDGQCCPIETMRSLAVLSTQILINANSLVTHGPGEIYMGGILTGMVLLTPARCSFGQRSKKISLRGMTLALRLDQVQRCMTGCRSGWASEVISTRSKQMIWRWHARLC